MKILFIFWLIFYAVSKSVIAAEAPLPVEAFSQLPDVTDVSLSPDGKSVVSLVRYQEEDSLGVVLHHHDLDSGKWKLLLKTDNSKFVISWIDWAGSNDSVLIGVRYPQRFYSTNITSTRLLRVDVASNEMNTALPKSILRKADYSPIIQDQVIDTLPNDPDEILVALRMGNAVQTEVFRINHKKSTGRRVHRPRSYTMNWITDQQHKLRIAWYFKDTTMRIDYRDRDSKKWSPLFEFESFDGSHKYPLGFDADPNILYYLALHEGRDAVFKADVSKRPLQPELVYSDENYDVTGRLVYSTKTDRVVGIQHSLGDGYIFWDEVYNNLQKSINKGLPDTNNKVIDFSRDERRAIVLATSDVEPGVYFLWDRDKKTLNNFAARYSKLESNRLAEKNYISYQARDGLTIKGYLTRGIGNEDILAPSIVFPHGGPISYDGKGFDYWTQYFASRGYNVLQMNFRGSSGYGHDFMTSGLKDWGGKMQTDVEDGTRWMIEKGIADPKRICVVGASYGGYAALMEAANNPELYQCIISFAGVTDLPYLVRHSQKFVNSKVVQEMVGSKRKELLRRSPVSRAKEIDIPVLLVQGSKDLVVPPAHGRRMHKKLVKADKDVTYVELKDGDHYLSNEEHRVSFFNQMDVFLTKHLD